jgi:hypothetical protein
MHDGKLSKDMDELHVSKLSYAVALLDGATRIVRSEKEPSLDHIGIPFYLLVGFGIENALKALLQYQSAPGKWQLSHDLADLLVRSDGLEQRLLFGAGDMIKHLSRYHREYWFRYPEKATIADVYKPVSALVLLNDLIGHVFDMTGKAKTLGTTE